MKILVIGSSNVDFNITLPKLPQVGETLLAEGMRISYGGKGANQALTCGKLGADVKFLSAVGNDEHGTQIIKNLEAVNVDCDDIKISKDQMTGTAYITIDNAGQNTIVVNPGANYTCDVEYLKEHDDAFKETDYVLLQMEIPLDAIEYAIKRSHELGKKVILNPAPALKDLDVSLYSKIDYFTPNETELDVMSEILGTFESMDDKISALLNAGMKNIITTLGEKGAYLVNNKTQKLIPAIEVEALDTVGAGDCFNGAFVSALAQGKDEVDAIYFANQAASIAVTKTGAQEAVPTQEEINKTFNL